MKAAFLQLLENTDEEFGVRELEVRQLLRQTGMHIVDKFETENWFEETTEKDRLLMGMNEVVMVAQKETNGPKHHENVKEKFQEGRPYLYIAEKSKTRDSDDSHSWDINVLSLTVGK